MRPFRYVFSTCFDRRSDHNPTAVCQNRKPLMLSQMTKYTLTSTSTSPPILPLKAEGSRLPAALQLFSPVRRPLFSPLHPPPFFVPSVPFQPLQHIGRSRKVGCRNEVLPFLHALLPSSQRRCVSLCWLLNSSPFTAGQARFHSPPALRPLLRPLVPLQQQDERCAPTTACS